MNVRHRKPRSGNVLVFSTVLMIVLFAVIAFAVDLGYLYVVRSELQRTADATALAAAWTLWEAESETEAGDILTMTYEVNTAANQYASFNTVAGMAPSLTSEDVTVGYLQADGTVSPIASPLIAVQTRIQKAANHQNGAIPLFFARVMGISSSDQEALATAVFVNNFSGFTTPTSGENVGILPFALDEETWQDLLDGLTDDDWTWNETLGQAESGPDGILEVNIFPQGTGAPGNRGTVDIGNNNNSTNDIKRQILEGVSPDDLAYHGGSLEFDENGELPLNGDTGISAAVKTQLEQIKGEPRIIPIFSQVAGPGNNAWYTIVKFAGVRIMEVKLTGSMSTKRVIIQPAKVYTHAGIPGDGAATSWGILSPVWLVQ